MAKTSEEVVFEGWLTKSPPTNRIFKARWRRRWFLLTHSGELPGQYILTYYTDRNRRKLKGVIDLDHCEQVDLGLKLEERKLKFDHVFDIKTPTRTYYLAAESDSEMRSWVNCICKVCGLKSTREEEEIVMPLGPPDVEITEEPLPTSPIGTSPYIPISECITGSPVSPHLDPKDVKTLLEYNMKNHFFLTEHHSSEAYDLSHRNYLNWDHDSTLDSRFYDSPRKLTPANLSAKNHSPLQSPTYSESVFNDEEWENNTSSEISTLKNQRRSDSSVDVDIIVTQKFVKDPLQDSISSVQPPPRPPKSLNVAPQPNYFNISSIKTAKEDESVKYVNKVGTSDLYDLPRSHVDENTLRWANCYNNAVPVTSVDGTIFTYDVSPKPGTSAKVFKFDPEDIQDEPSSPAHSHTSSNVGYSNLPSPLSDNQLMPPPLVNRELKPKRKLSDSHSSSSNPEPASPRNAPTVDRKLKPPTPIQDAQTRKNISVDEDNKKVRAAPSPSPPGLERTRDSLVSQTDIEDSYLTHMQYLDLDLVGAGSSGVASNKAGKIVKASNPIVEADIVYKKVDFAKTAAFNITRNNLEKERQEPPTTTFSKK